MCGFDYIMTSSIMIPEKAKTPSIYNWKISTKFKFPTKMTDFQYRYDIGDSQLACNLFF